MQSHGLILPASDKSDGETETLQQVISAFGMDGWDGMGWDGMGWDGMGWGGVGWNGVEWGGVGWGGLRLDLWESMIAGRQRAL